MAELKIRFQLNISPDRYEKLRNLAFQQGKSMIAVATQALDEFLKKQEEVSNV